MELERNQRDHEWVDRIREGDRKAFRSVYCTYYPELCRYATRFVSKRAVVDDLIQDVFLRIWERREDWHVRSMLRPYLYGAVRNRALKYITRRRLHRDYVEAESGISPNSSIPLDRGLRENELQETLQACLEELPERRREIFMLSRFHDLTYAEIALTLDISVKTVETQMSRSLKLFRERFAPIRAAAA